MSGLQPDIYNVGSKSILNIRKRDLYLNICKCAMLRVRRVIWKFYAQLIKVHLFTLEALWIRQLNPEINVRDEYKSRELVIKF